VTADAGAGSRSAAARLGFQPSMALQELGWDEDVDEDLRADIEAFIGTSMVGGDVSDVVDGVLLWWRNGDGDLVDALVDALTDLGEGGAIWLLTPKVGRDAHVDPADVAEAAPVAGLSTTTTQAASAGWAATRLVTPKHSRKVR
jgi:hypothetical protein